MKKLKKIKLINWHYFSNETIEIEGNTLITGENGAGKSTILDALQFVLAPGKYRFNIAANDGNKRTATSYIRGKLGKSNQKYLRAGDISCHISLEFYDDKNDRSLVYGVVLDSKDVLSTPNSLFYAIDDFQIDDQLYITDKYSKNIKEFKAFLKSSKLNYKHTNTLKAARELISEKLEIFDYNYFDLLPKALAFKPINNVKDFIYTYILEERNLDVEYLIGNIKTYKEFSLLLDEINEKIADLEMVENIHQKVNEYDVKIRHDLYIHKRLKLDYLEDKISENNILKQKIDLEVNNYKTRLLEINGKLDSLISKKDDLNLSLLVDDDYKVFKRLKLDRSEILEKITVLTANDDKINVIISKELARAKELLNSGYDSTYLNAFLQYENCEINLLNLNEFSVVINNYYDFISKIKNEIKNKVFKENIQKTTVEKELKELYQENKLLNERKVLINSEVLKFKNELKEKLAEKYKKSEINPIILCQVLDISDIEWQNAIEGYLGKDRFNILIEPEHFLEALKIYKNIRSKYKQSISIVDTRKIIKYDYEKEDSLASLVTSEYQLAKYYVNYRLNNVVRCSKANDLPKHNVAVTKDCLIYRGFVLSELNRFNYNKLYIGNKAYETQLVRNGEKVNSKKEILIKINNDITELNSQDSYLSLNNLATVLQKFDIKINRLNAINKLKEIDKTIDSLENLSIDDKRKMLTAVETEVIEFSKRQSEITKEINILEHQLIELNNVEEITIKLGQSRQELVDYEIEVVDIIEQAREKYLQYKNLDYKTTFKNIELQLNKNRKIYFEKINELVLLQKVYITKHDFKGEDGLDNIEEFYEELQRLRNSHLLKFTGKVEESRKRSEKELKEHFLFRIYESIVNAHNYFAALNQSLDAIKFGTDHYRFKIMPNTTHLAYYEMFYNCTKFHDNVEGFSEKFLKEYGEILDELMDYLIQDDLNEQMIIEMLDYRTYMDYDIEIIHAENSVSLLSEISREKSGGETQIPYYVSMASTFVKIYQKSNLEVSSIGIVLFDEAFDKIDSIRTEAVMKFLGQLGLQVILSTPPQKVEDIYPYVESTLIVTREKNQSWVFSLNKLNLKKN